jgi:thioredoxin reductase (NADPH)
VLLLEREGMLEVLRDARVTRIEPDRVHMDVAGRALDRPNDYVFVLIGGLAPSALLRESGVDLETKFGTPLIRR